MQTVVTGRAGYSSTDVTWGESAITWNNKPAASATNLGTDTVTYNNNTDQWYEWDVSSYVAQQKAAGATAVTFVLKPGNTTDSKASFNSREAAANQPQLVVTPDSGTTTATTGCRKGDIPDNESGHI